MVLINNYKQVVILAAIQVKKNTTVKPNTAYIFLSFGNLTKICHKLPIPDITQ